MEWLADFREGNGDPYGSPDLSSIVMAVWALIFSIDQAVRVEVYR